MTGYGSMHRVFSKLSDWQHTIFLSPNLKPKSQAKISSLFPRPPFPISPNCQKNFLV